MRRLVPISGYPRRGGGRSPHQPHPAQKNDQQQGQRRGQQPPPPTGGRRSWLGGGHLPGGSQKGALRLRLGVQRRLLGQATQRGGRQQERPQLGSLRRIAGDDGVDRQPARQQVQDFDEYVVVHVVHRPSVPGPFRRRVRAAMARACNILTDPSLLFTVSATSLMGIS